MYQDLLYIIAKFTNLLFVVIDLAMFVRMVFSWFPDFDGLLVDIVYALTEPVVAPIRAVLERLEFFRSFPLDLSFIIAYLLVGAAQTLLWYFTELVL